MVAAALATALAFSFAVFTFVFAEQRDENRLLRERVADLERANKALRDTAFKGVSRFEDIINRMELDG